MLDLFKAIGLGLVVLLPLANPLTTVALFLGLAGNMNSAERNRQSLMASVYVFSSGAIMRLVGKGGIEAISRLMGFLLVCMGVQFIINGILEIIKTYH
ncbi:hypothetical protein O5698_21390 [Escherichia coli]|nr:hypothetical protein [Escherichia coli]